MADALRVQITADASEATNQIHLVVDNTKELEAALSGAGAAGLEAGEEISEGMQKAEYSTMEARHAAMLLGEETGVHIPRALSGLISKSETLGPIMAKAFSGIAVLAFAELAVKAGEKLSEWIANTFIFTAAEQELNKQLLESNKQIADYTAKTQALSRAYDEIGLKGSQLTDVKIGFSTDDILKTEAEIRRLQDQMYMLRNEGEGSTPEYGKLADALGVQFAKLKMQQQESQNLTKEFVTQQEKEAEEAAKKRLAIEEKLDKDIIKARQELLREGETAEKEQEKITEERLMSGVKAELKASEEAINAQDRQLKGYIAMTQGEIKATEQADSAKERTLQNEFSQRKITGEQYLASLQELYNSEVNALMNAVNQEEELYVILAKNEASKRGEILTDEEAQESAGFQSLEKKKLEIQQGFIAKYTSAEEKMQAEQQKVINASLTKMNSEFASTFANIEMGHETLGKGAQRMWANLETAALQSLAKIALAEVEGMLLHRTSAEQQSLLDAKSAAKGAYKGVMESAIPFPFNIPLAIAAGAGAFATVMAFDQGGMVPEDQMSMVHAGEGVLTAPQVETIRQAADNMGDGGGGGGGDIHIHAMDAQSFVSFLKKNPGALAQGIHGAAKGGHLNIASMARGK